MLVKRADQPAGDEWVGGEDTTWLTVVGCSLVAPAPSSQNPVHMGLKSISAWKPADWRVILFS